MVTKKRDNAVAYKPLINTDVPAIVEKVDNLEIQNYEEIGVSYHGFSRAKIGQEQYKILRQRRFVDNRPITILGPSTSTWTINDNYLKENLYIQHIIVGFRNITADTTLTLSDTNSGNLFIQYIPTGSGWFYIDYDTPFEVKNQSISLTYSSPGALTGTLSLTATGFAEEKP